MKNKFFYILLFIVFSNTSFSENLNIQSKNISIDKHSKLTDQYNSYLFGSTSLALDFYLKNKNIVIFKDEVNLNLSPLFDYVTKKFSDHETYNIIKNNKYGKKYFFNLNPKLKMWKKIINC